MKKYKLRRWYPSLNKAIKEGALAELFQNVIECTSEHVHYNFYRTENGYIINPEEIENNPEYWEEIIEKDYEILSFKSLIPFKAGHIVTVGKTSKSAEDYLKTPEWIIHSVKRLSDGEIFTVGDTINNSYCNTKILNFNISSFGNLEVLTNSGTTSLRLLSQSKKDYEILSFNNGASNTDFNEDLWYSCQDNGTKFRFTIEEMFELGHKIFSIKRLSDNTIFTIGDFCKINGNGWSDNSRIMRFEIIKGELYANFGVISTHINWIKPVKEDVIPVEKDSYEVINFRNEDSNCYIQKDGKYSACIENLRENGHYTKEKMLSLSYKIHSVKRLSDGEIFTVGNKLSEKSFTKDSRHLLTEEYPHDNIITKIGIVKNHRKEVAGFSNNKDISQNNKLMFSASNRYGNYNVSLEKAAHFKVPLFTTKDGVDLFEGDGYWKVLPDRNYSLWDLKASNICARTNITTFSTKDAAEEYILMNKPCLSVNDVINTVGFAGCTAILKLKKLVKNKQNLGN